MQMSSVASSGSIENNRLVRDGRVDIAMTTPDLAYNAYKGIEMYDEPDEDLRYLFTGHLMPSTIITLEKNTDINTIADLRGKRVGVGDIGSAVFSMAKIALEAGGPALDDINQFHLSQGETKDGVLDGSLDAGSLTAGVPHPSVLEAVTIANIKILPLPHDDLNKYLAKQNPGIQAAVLPGVLPGGTYPGIDEDIEVPILVTAFVASAKVPDDVVYEVVKTLYSNVDQLAKVHPAGKEYLLDHALSGQSIPLHPGAERYFKEVGLLK